jgi:hypothetical protein
VGVKCPAKLNKQRGEKTKFLGICQMSLLANGTFKLEHMIISKLKKQSTSKINIVDISQML